MTPPVSEAELMERADQLAGEQLGAVAKRVGVIVPNSLLRAKGWTGELLEKALGAMSGSAAQPDFPGLGIELKSIPIGRDHRPSESTFVTIVPLIDNIGLTWQDSIVRAKLARILWIPVEADDSLPLGQRHIGNPMLWSPSREEEQVLRTDFEELMEMVSFGKAAQISAHHGTWLQIRPKAANSQAFRSGIGREGRKVQTLPLGFYLRRSFTEALLDNYFAA